MLILICGMLRKNICFKCLSRIFAFYARFPLVKAPNDFVPNVASNKSFFPNAESAASFHDPPPTPRPAAHSRLSPMPDIVLSHTAPGGAKPPRRGGAERRTRRAPVAAAKEAEDAEDHTKSSKLWLASPTVSDNKESPLLHLSSSEDRTTHATHNVPPRAHCVHCYRASHSQTLIQDIGCTLKHVGDDFQAAYIMVRTFHTFLDT